MPDACWKKWMPMPDSRMRRMAGVGDRMSSFHTRFSFPLPLLGTVTTSPSSSSGMPAAALMSARRSAASSAVSEVFSSTTLASARRPFMTSHRGDSGMPSTMSASSTDGAAPMPSMMRHPRFSGKREKA
ncbi:Os07g0582450 [Oryza sativa Japonica Group]|uniref:Os07g0582450 protein n=1 Tax=Oryza sativa subsp. japonica TaxID=39947 RepID=A0A0N7KNR4_ORYSJ|nr:hypothetical protein EE612_040308 [Oryza sativa]BAT02346.1 Os07g0582450 [Oryza sativa Japonica Group]